MADLDRFVRAQDALWPQPLDELLAGQKRGHWMWFVFPQLAGLGRSETARFYGIAGVDEARGYLAHPLLGARLRQCAEAMLCHAGRAPEVILGSIDALKLRSSATLFEASGEPLFAQMLDTFYAGERDPLTLGLLQL